MALGATGLEQGASPRGRLVAPGGPCDRVSKQSLFWLIFFAACLGKLPAQESPPTSASKKENVPGRLAVPPANKEDATEIPFEVPLPAHATKNRGRSSPATFRILPSRSSPAAPVEEPPAQAEYLLPDRDEKPPILPENANLNLPADLEITAKETGEEIILPAGTYRQILQIPIDSPLMQTTGQIRRDQALPVEVKKEHSRYVDPPTKPVWVRYESLEKIKIGQAERRGGIDLPSHGPKDLGPRGWYAKSETADWASSVFYFAFGGLGYSTANLLGWSAGNTREIPGDFEYRLIRK